ncbi:MAG: AlpA family transcriptional regulator [Oceanospirillaceae bacterium]|nr:AlpA family transcriptional regulator [Oceanospirillaceae bacterium]
MSKRIIRRPQVESLTGLSRSTIYRRMDDGTFPKSISIGGRLQGWLESDIQGWITEQIEAAGLEA